MKVSTGMDFVCKSFGDQGAKEHLHWLPIEDLDNYHLYPEFFKTKLSRGINGIEHIISKE